MPKNIILCADGTWNTADEKDNGKLADTNVRRLYDALPMSSPEQVKIYDPGVGTSGDWWARLTGGAFGDGLVQNVKHGYRQIASVFEPGDKIYLVGFSRGAYTARSIAGMIANVGLPPHDKAMDKKVIDDAFTAYRDVKNRPGLLAKLKQDYGNMDTPIEAVAVWDTVGSLGIPGGLFANWDQNHYGFLDTKLHPNVKSAFHAMAIDEERRSFAPTLWTPPFAPGQQVKQVWFSGVHSDVGGGYAEAKDSLSNITLGWMMRQLCGQGEGVKFEPEARKKLAYPDAKNVEADQHDSWHWYWGDKLHREIAADATLSNSVAMRMRLRDDYRPSNLATGFPDKPCDYATETTVPQQSRTMLASLRKPEGRGK